jgi:protein TonB
MRAAYLRSEESLRRPLNARSAAIARAIEAIEAEAQPARYEGSTGPNWWAIGVLVIGHAALFLALALAGVTPIFKKAKPPIVVELIPLPEAPPPPPAPAPKPTVEVVQPVAAVAPPPIVAVQIVSPIQTVAVAPPPEPAPAPPSEATAPSTVSASLPSTSLSMLPGNPPLRPPREALVKRLQGTVRLRIVIDTEGRVADIGIAASSGHECLDEAALKTVRKWRFVPKVENGRPVMAVGYLPARFILN